MAITTLDGAVAGFKAPEPLMKVGITMSAVGAARGYTPWYVAGRPGASTAPSIGVNGEAVTAASGANHYTLTTTATSFSVTGVPAGIKAARKLTSTTQTYTTSGSNGVDGATSITAQRVLSAIPSPYVMTGNDASLLYGTNTYYGVLRRYNGASWVKADLKVFNGSTWEQKALKVWSGSSWESVDATGV